VQPFGIAPNTRQYHPQVKITSEHLRRRAAGDSIRSIARRAGVAPSTMSHAFKVHDAEVAAKADRCTAAEGAKADKQRLAAQRKAARLATQPAPAPHTRLHGQMRINRRALRRLNGLGSETDAYLAWLDKPKNLLGVNCVTKRPRRAPEERDGSVRCKPEAVTKRR
jgi:hypothetical protein